MPDIPEGVPAINIVSPLDIGKFILNYTLVKMVLVTSYYLFFLISFEPGADYISPLGRTSGREQANTEETVANLHAFVGRLFCGVGEDS